MQQASLDRSLAYLADNSGKMPSGAKSSIVFMAPAFIHVYEDVKWKVSYTTSYSPSTRATAIHILALAIK